MLVLAPDPRLGIAPERVARVRAMLDEVAESGGSVPGIVVALPGGPDGILDAVVVRPDGVIGLAPVTAEAREPVGAGGRSAPDAPPSSRVSTTDVEAELDRLLALPDPPCPAPRRILGTGGSRAVDTTGVPDPTHGALAAPVGSFRVLDLGDLRRFLMALRLADHLPTERELAAAGFLDAATPAARAGAAPPVPAARKTPSAPHVLAPSSLPPRSTSDDVPLLTTAPVPVPGPPRTGRLPESRPESASDSVSGAASGSAPSVGGSVSSPAGRSPGRWPRQAPSRARRYGSGALPAWVWGWPGLTLAALATFGVALVLALMVGRATTGSSGPPPDPTATRTVDGVTYSRQVATSDVSCDGHAYGLAAGFLRERGCLHLDRTLWTGTDQGRPVVVAVSTVQMPDTTTAFALRSLVDTSGTGNISDLLREGRGFPGAPQGLTGAGYASAQLGDRVVVAEADGIDPSFTDGDELDRLSRAGLALR
jgi:hypothetical protein